MTPLQKMQRAVRIAKKAAARVKDPELRQIAYELVYLHALEH